MILNSHKNSFIQKKIFLNPQSGYYKIDVYLLNLMSITSDVKSSHNFLLIKLK